MNKLLRYHPRILIAAIAGIAIFFLLPGRWSVLSRVLVGWDLGVALFLILIYFFMAGLTAEQIALRYKEEDPSAPAILIIVTVAALLSLGAIVQPMMAIKQASGTDRIADFVLAAFTLINSWLLVGTVFTTHYADMYYSAPESDRPLHFPDTPMPAFWDFAYFSFTISAACQTADVATTRTSIRKVVVAHAVISFLFNASILGFAINVTAGLIDAG